MNFKKTIILTFSLVLSLSYYAQDGKISYGANVGLPTGTTSDVYSFSLGADATYLLNSDEDFSYGAAVNLQYYIGKSIGGFDVENALLLPIAGAGRYKVSDEFLVGADLGYALILSGGSGGTFYFKPLVGYNLSDTMQLNAFFSKADTISNFGVGIMFSL